MNYSNHTELRCIKNMENSLQALNASQALEDWSFKIKECRNSGLTVLDWCKSQGIKPQRFYYWQKKLFTLLSQQPTTEFAELPLHTSSKTTCSNDIIARISINGLTIEISGNATKEQIATLIAALKQC